MSNLTPAKCPVCCRDLSLDMGSQFTFCKYCGSKFNVLAGVAFRRATDGASDEKKADDFIIVDGRLKMYRGDGENVEIPKNVTVIGAGAFQKQTKIKSVTIPDFVRVIEDGAFVGCTGLTSVVIPEGVSSIGKFTFSGCDGLTSVSLPESVTSIGDVAFSGCRGLTSFTFPSGVSSIGNGVFSGCTGLTEVSIPDNVTVIRKGTFRNCSSLESAELCPDLEDIEEEAFLGCTALRAVYVRNRTKKRDDWYSLPPKMNMIRYHVFSRVPRALVFMCVDRILVNWSLSDPSVYSFFESNGLLSVCHKMHKIPLLFYKTGDELVRQDNIGRVFCERGNVLLEDGRTDEQKRLSGDADAEYLIP